MHSQKPNHDLAKKLNGCQQHKKEGSTCSTVIAMGLCKGYSCKLFLKVLRMIPRFKRLYELEAQGVIPHTIWDFSEKGMKGIERRKKKAQKWLGEFYPKIEQQLSRMGVRL